MFPKWATGLCIIWFLQCLPINYMSGEAGWFCWMVFPCKRISHIMLIKIMLRWIVFCYVILCYVMLCFVMLCYVVLCYAMLCYAMICYAMLCYAMLCYVISCHVMTCHVMSCYVMLCWVTKYRVIINTTGMIRVRSPSNVSIFQLTWVIRCHFVGSLYSNAL